MSDAGASHAKPRVLVVDDSKVMRLAAAKHLRDEYEVVLAEDGEDGWNKLTGDPSIRAVFSDLSMPRLDGYQFLDRVRGAEDPRLAEMAVIVITGEEDDERSRERALAQGATDFITKPFDAVDLKARARAHISSAHTTDALKQQARELAERTTIDAVTGLGNREQFIDALKQDRSYALRHKQDLALLYLDLGDFDGTLSSLGQPTVDRILQQVAQTVRARIRYEDTAARVGRSRFAVSLPSANAVGARHLGERLRREIADGSFGPDDDRAPVKVTISVGVSSLDPRGAESVEQMLDSGERAAAEAMRTGNCVVTDSELGPGAGDANSAQTPVNAPTRDETVPRVDQALALISRGELDKVRPYLAPLMTRLAPLLQLAQNEQPEALREALTRRE